MDHVPGASMLDQQGRFQRCRHCSARRVDAKLGFGFWYPRDCGDAVVVAAVEPGPPPSREDLVKELYAD